MRLRLILSFTLIVLFTVASVVILARQSTANEVRSFMTTGGMTGIDELVRTLEDFYSANQTWEGVDSLLAVSGHGPGMGPGGGQGMMGGMMGQRLKLADVNGNLVFDSAARGTGTGAQLSPAELEEAVPLRSGGDTAGYLLAQGGMGFNRGAERPLLLRLNRAAMTAGLAAGGVSLLVAILLAYSLLRPVRDLTRAAEHLARGDLSRRVPVHGSDELATLGRTFNNMADSLQKVEQTRRALTADIAHELRNPLAVQRANLEALQDGIYPLTSENLAPVLEQNHLLTRLVEDLRTLALADSGQLRLERADIDFPSLAGRVVELFAAQAASRNIRLRYDPAPAPPLNIDPNRVEQILNNLLSNALRYTPDDGEITVSVSSADPQLQGAVQLHVRDSGPGIPTEALPHVFERFYRADRSRSRGEGGSGLGLAIARQLAEAHGGTLEAANHPEGGAVFTLTLP
jgi:two-component system OmpR family sensor kinase/two-component system sensor histidine kinase BaeS